MAASLGIPREHLTLFGDDKAKVSLAALDSGRPPGKLILVSAITPTAAGEGKTTTSIGLAQGLRAHRQERLLALRRAVARPGLRREGRRDRRRARAGSCRRSDINLHFTGDFHAITAAHNLLAAMLDNHLHFGNALGIDPRQRPLAARAST